jgi:hypothetical protein
VAQGEAVVVVSSASGAFEAEEKARDERLEALKTEFRLNPGQANEVRRVAKGKGIAYLEERVAYARANAKKNRTAYLLKLLREEAQITAEPERKPKRPLKPDPQTLEPAAAPAAEPLPLAQAYAAEWAFWQGASEDLRQAWLQDDFLRRWAPKPGQEPRRAFLSRLHDLMPLAQRAAAEAGALVTPKPSKEAAA